MRFITLVVMVWTLCAVGCATSPQVPSEKSIRGVPKVVPLYQHGGTIVGPQGAMSGDRHGRELRVVTDAGDYVFDWLMQPCALSEGVAYTFVLSPDEKSLRSIRDSEGETIWQDPGTFVQAAVPLLRIEFSQPRMNRG